MTWFWLLLLGFMTTTFIITSFITDRVYAKQIELDELNILYQCDVCGKFHRKYQEELQLQIDPHYTKHLTCPSCYGTSSLYAGEEFRWIDNNPQAPKLTKRDVKKIKKALWKVEKLRYEDQSIEKFLYYYRLNLDKKNSDD